MMSRIRQCRVQSTSVSISGTYIRIARLSDEWHEDVDDPVEFVRRLKKANVKADLLTFWQRLPHTTPRFSYHRETDDIAVLPITTYEHWLHTQINNKTRNLVNKAYKRGVVVKLVNFDDAFVRGMTAIFNESPVRQGMRFWHYGKNFDTIKREFSTFLFRESILGAYCDDELIGFAFIVNAGQFAMLGQIISKITHRDKAPNNALIAKAVQVCAERQVPFLTYAVWPRPGSLRDFKRHNAFQCVSLPRYYVPLTVKGRAALAMNFHRSPVDCLPQDLVLRLKALRSRFYSWRYGDVALTSNTPSTQDK